MPQYPYDINARPVIISDGCEIPEINDLIRAILLNSDITPYLYQINNVIHGWSALMVAVLCSNTWSSDANVQLLINAGANLDLQHDKNGYTALIFAVSCTFKESTEKSVELLIKAGANLDLQDACGRTALMQAFHNNTVKMLIDAGANLNLQDQHGWTALMYADNYNTIEMLINAGANVNLPSNIGETVLMRESRFASWDDLPKNTIQLLLKAGANIELQDFYCNTVLEHSISFLGSQESIINILYNVGCNILKFKFIDSKYWSALNTILKLLSVKFEHADIVPFI
jgi:ankyrin repeat protein